jgi:hypothetical protein
MGIELWIGGMVLFGFGALLAETKYVSAKRIGDVRHQVQKDGSVIAQMPDGSKKRFANWKEFWAATH